MKPRMVVVLPSLFLLAMCLLAALLLGCDRFSESKTYDDCILQHMQGVASDVAAREIQYVCEQKFPLKK